METGTGNNTGKTKDCQKDRHPHLQDGSATENRQCDIKLLLVKKVIDEIHSNNNGSIVTALLGTNAIWLLPISQVYCYDRVWFHGVSILQSEKSAIDNCFCLTCITISTAYQNFIGSSPMEYS